LIANIYEKVYSVNIIFTLVLSHYITINPIVYSRVGVPENYQSVFFGFQTLLFDLVRLNDLETSQLPDDWDSNCKRMRLEVFEKKYFFPQLILKNLSRGPDPCNQI